MINEHIKRSKKENFDMYEIGQLTDEQWCDVDISLGFILIKLNLRQLPKLNSKVNFSLDGAQVNMGLEFIKSIYAK